MANIKSSHNFEVVSSGEISEKLRVLKDRNPFTQRRVQQVTYEGLQ
jgi:hypothetical protein